MRPVINKEAIVFDGSLNLERFEEVVSSRTGKNGNALSGRLNLLLEVPVYPNEILVDALPLGSTWLERLGPFKKFLPHKDVVVVLPMLIRLGIKIQTHHRQIVWFKSS